MMDTSELDRLAAGLDDWQADAAADVAGPTLEAMADAAAGSIRHQAARHRRTGAMERSIDVSSSGHGTDKRVRVTTGRVAKILVHGARRHDIGPSSRALPIAPYGFATRVHHPGSPPDPFVARGLHQAASALDSITTGAAADVADAVAQRITEG